MADPIDPWRRGERALEAYYYSFDPTGVREVDGILAAVALAGKSYHHTQDWNEVDGDEESLTDCIQRHAGIAAERFRALEREPTPADIAAWLQRNPDQVAEVLGAMRVAGPWHGRLGDERVRMDALRDDEDNVLVEVRPHGEDQWIWLYRRSGREVTRRGGAATHAEAMAAADQALVADGYALVGGVPEVSSHELTGGDHV